MRYLEDMNKKDRQDIIMWTLYAIPVIAMIICLILTKLK